MSLPNIHEFQLREVVNYEQLNDNFSNIVNYMLKYEAAQVTVYDTTTRQTTVMFDSGATVTVLNNTPFELAVNDNVYVYYWTDINVDGYIGLKLNS